MPFKNISKGKDMGFLIPYPFLNSATKTRE